MYQSHLLQYFSPHMHGYLGCPEALDGDQDTTNLGSFLRREMNKPHH